MKKWMLFLGVMTTMSLNASHILGGQIWYEYVTSVGNNDQYKIHLELYREFTGVGLGSAQTVNVVSTMGSVTNLTTSVSLVLSTPEYSLSIQNCGASTFTVRVNEYEGYVNIPKNSSTTFYWQTCCRPFGIDGISNSSGTGFYIEAKLNLENPSVRGYENSVKPSPIGILRLVQGIPNQVATPYTESDGDSIYATLKPAKEYNATNGPSNLVYAPGYSPATPIHSDTLMPFGLDPGFNGFYGKPTTIETSVVSVRVDNYVLDTVSNQPFRIGYINIDIPVTVGVGTASNAQPIYIASYQASSVHKASVALGSPVYSSSITPNFSELTVTDLNAQPVSAISSVSAFTNLYGLADTLLIDYDTTLTSGKYWLQIAKGSDSTTFIGECGGTVPDTSFLFNIPFHNSVIVGPQNPYISGFYHLSNSENIDSILWTTSSGTLLLNGNPYSSLVTSPEDSVELVCSVSPTNLMAIRFGNQDADTLDITITPTGIGVPEAELGHISVTPNPNNGIFSLKVQKSFLGGRFVLTDALGRPLFSGPLTSESLEIELPELNPGIYYIHTTAGWNSKSTAVIVK
jgi:hypothetical protein